MRTPILATALLTGTALLATCGGDDDGDDTTDGVTIDASPDQPDAPPGQPDAGGNCTPVQGTPTLDLEQLPGTYQEPTAAVVPPGDTRIFVVSKPGVIRIIDGDTAVATPFLDIQGVVNDNANERGLLGLAFHPDYQQNRRFYVYYTAGDGAMTLAEYTANSDFNTADAGSGDPLLSIPHSRSNHNGGWLGFGPDGYLYMATGDGGSGGDPDEAGQSLTTLAGKILRLDVNTAGMYVIPANNPFAGMGGGVRGEIWAYGLRNPWRNSFDRMTGDLYIGDVGQDFMEEINVQPAASTGGENYGWDVMEGTTCFNENNFTNPLGSCTMTGITLPVEEYQHNGSGASTVGGYVYRGCAMPGYHGTYFYGDTVDRFVRSFKWNGAGGVTDEATHAGLANHTIFSFGEDANGEILLLDAGNGTNGRVYRIVPQP